MVQKYRKEISPRAFISLRSIRDLTIVKKGKTIRIGAMATINDLILDPQLNDTYPILIEAAKALGCVQIRNVATIGGNLCNCSPSADMATPLLVHEARIRLQTSHQTREIPIHEFFLGPGESRLASDEILTEILLSSPNPRAKTLFLKIGRVKMDLAIASIALLLELERDRCRKARLAAGSVAPIPMRLLEVEKLLEGSLLSQELIDEAQKLASESVAPITDVRATEEYRRYIIGVLVKRGIEKILGWSQD
jgi:carbon-monoxide dehydrogenase medium subunit